MAQGNSGEAQRQAAAAASLLREAQRDLMGDQAPPEDQQSEQSAEQEKLIEKIRELRDQQATVLAQIIVLEDTNKNARAVILSCTARFCSH